MNKNNQFNKLSQSQNINHVKTALGNKVEKNPNFQKTKDLTKGLANKNIKIQNKFKIKTFNRAQNNNISKNPNKKNPITHSRSKSKSRSNNQRQNKLASGKSKDKSPNQNSNRVKSSEQNNKNDKNNIINIFPKPISFDKIKSDLNNINNFFKPCYNPLKIDLKKIAKKINMNEEILKNTTNYENLKYISLNDTSSLFMAWQNSSIIYKVFEEKLLKKNNFEIDKNTLEIKTKNSESCKALNDQKFWILYVEYLINNNYLINENQFLSIINEAFSYMGDDCAQLRIYYLQKIKKYSPCFLPDGSLDDSDDTYLNKLNKSTVNFIKNQKGAFSSNVHLTSTNKKKNYKINEDIRNIKIDLNNENKPSNIMDKKDNKKIICDKNNTGDADNEFEIIENSEK